MSHLISFQVLLVNNASDVTKIINKASEIKKGQNVIDKIQITAEKFQRDFKSHWKGTSQVNLSDISGSVRNMGKCTFFFSSFHNYFRQVNVEQASASNKYS